jgi:hypothetical protein
MCFDRPPWKGNETAFVRRALAIEYHTTSSALKR